MLQEVAAEIVIHSTKKVTFTDEGLKLPIFCATGTITNVTQYEISQEESDLLKSGLYFSVQPDKIRKSEILKIFEIFNL